MISIIVIGILIAFVIMAVIRLILPNKPWQWLLIIAVIGGLYVYHSFVQPSPQPVKVEQSTEPPLTMEAIEANRKKEMQQ